jgi:alcohol dehydrogenase (cytochrome c)
MAAPVTGSGPAVSARGLASAAAGPRGLARLAAVHGAKRGTTRSLSLCTCLLVALAMVITACGSAKPTAAKRPACKPLTPAGAAATAAPQPGAWAYPNGDLANTRVATGSAISSANVSRLRQAWTFRLTGTAAAGVEGSGSFAANPIVTGGVVYIQDLDANVYAVDLATGKLKWEYPVNIPEATGPGPDGVAVADGRVYGDSSTAVFALSAATGKPVWVDRQLLKSGQGKFEIQPQVAGGRLYIASAYGSGPGGGVLLALNAATGKLIWRFNTITGADTGARDLGLGAGGAWETPLVGSDGSVTFGIGNPYQSIGAAFAHPAAALYTDSEVNLNAATGGLCWYYQAVPDDFEDHDLQGSPIAASVNGVPVVIASGKVGYVYAMNASTGKLMWKTPVGEHNGHDDESVLAMQHKRPPKLPYTFLPGGLGGVLTNMAVAGGSIYLATVDVPFEFTSLKQADGIPVSSSGGEVEALSLATGKVEWDTKVPELPLGAATVTNDLVFTTLYNGELIALNRSTGAIVYRHALPTSTNSPIAIAGNTVIVPAGGPETSAKGGGGSPQLVAYTLPTRR